MALERRPLPPYDPDMRSMSVFETVGLMDTAPAGSESGQYRRFPLVSGTPLDVELPEGTHTLWASTHLTAQVTLALSELDNPAPGTMTHRVYLLVGGVFMAQALVPDAVAMPFEFNEAVWLVSADGTLLELSGNIFQTRTATLQQRMADLGVADVPVRTVAVWLGRVFVGIGDQLMWSDSFNPTEWRSNYTDAETSVVVPTNAGSTQIPAETIMEILPLARRMLLFSEDAVHDIETSNIDIELPNVTELLRGVRYRGGGANHRGLAYLLTDSGVRVIDAGGGSELISLDVDSATTRAIAEADTLSVGVLGDFVIWAVAGCLIYFNTKWRRFAPPQPHEGGSIGNYRSAERTIDDLTGTIDGLGGAINDLSSPAMGELVVVSHRRALPFRQPQRVSLSVNIERAPGNIEHMVREVSAPELGSYTAQVRSVDDTAWSGAVDAAPLGRCKFNRRMVSPSVRFETSDEFDTIQMYMVDLATVRVG